MYFLIWSSKYEFLGFLVSLNGLNGLLLIELLLSDAQSAFSFPLTDP